MLTMLSFSRLNDLRCVNISLSDRLVYNNMCFDKRNRFIVTATSECGSKQMKIPSYINTYACTPGKRRL